jgi:hypothetical protein
LIPLELGAAPLLEPHALSPSASEAPSSNNALPTSAPDLNVLTMTLMIDEITTNTPLLYV